MGWLVHLVCMWLWCRWGKVKEKGMWWDHCAICGSLSWRRLAKCKCIFSTMFVYTLTDIHLMTQCHTSQRWLNKKKYNLLRIPDTYEAKIAKICNFWTFQPVIQLINNLLAKLQARMSRSCQFLIFLPHKYQVSLMVCIWYAYPLRKMGFCICFRGFW